MLEYEKFIELSFSQQLKLIFNQLVGQPLIIYPEIRTGVVNLALAEFVFMPEDWQEYAALDKEADIIFYWGRFKSVKHSELHNSSKVDLGELMESWNKE